MRILRFGKPSLEERFGSNFSISIKKCFLLGVEFSGIKFMGLKSVDFYFGHLMLQYSWWSDDGKTREFRRKFRNSVESG